jgi:hypothetical protein
MERRAFADRPMTKAAALVTRTSSKAVSGGSLVKVVEVFRVQVSPVFVER